MKTIIRCLPKSVDPYLLLGSSIWLYKYGNVYDQIYDDFPDIGIYKASMTIEGDDLIKMPKSVGVGSIEIATIVDNLKPDLMITIADRYETLATATVAAYCNIPLIHLQGGEVSGTIDDKVRNTITQLADYHFPATNLAATRIATMRGSRENIWNFGCPSMDLMIGWDFMKTLYRNKLAESFDADHKQLCKNGRLTAFAKVNAHGYGDEITNEKNHIIVMIHPDTKNPITRKNIDTLFDVLNGYENYQKIVFWNNIDPGGEMISKEIRFTQERYWNSPVRFLKHIEPEAFGALLYFASAIVGNSSAGIREASFIGTPSISVGDRQRGREHADNVRFSDWDEYELRCNVKRAVCSIHPYSSALYGVGDAGMRIAAKIGEIADAI